MLVITIEINKYINHWVYHQSTWNYKPGRYRLYFAGDGETVSRGPTRHLNWENVF